MTNKNFRDIHPGHARTTLRDESRIVTFAAADIETFQAFHGRQQSHERRRVQLIAVRVVARAREFRPRFGVTIPTFPNREMIHIVRALIMRPTAARIDANAPVALGSKKKY
ncbi:MAG: hypothetical protein WCG63_05605 [Opitutaceae bacterium]